MSRWTDFQRHSDELFQGPIQQQIIKKFGHRLSEPEGDVRVDQPNQSRTPTPPTPVGGFARLLNSFPIPLRKQNMATISFYKLPLEKTDLDLLKKWIELMEENLTEAPNDPI